MKYKSMFAVFLLTFVLGVAAACTPKLAGPVTLTVITHDSFAVSDSVVNAFESQNNAKLEFVKSGDAGSALNRVILSKGSPQGDVFYGVDNTFLSRAIAEDVFEPYASPELDKIDASFKLAANNEASPVDFGDVCINYDKAWFGSHNLAVPQSLEDLVKPEYGPGSGKAGLLVMENPATSSPGLAFLLATISLFGEDQYLDYWKQLKQNGLVVVNDWETAYYTNFSGSSGKGAQPMVVSYASSPAAEVVFASSPLTDSPTASITAPGTCFRQVEFVGILKGTKNGELARKFVDFMLGKQFQEDMPLQMFVFPVNPEAALPDAFVKYAKQAEQPALLDPALVAKNRDRWIADWTAAILR